MNTTLTLPRQLRGIGRLGLFTAVAVVLLFAASLFASWLAPVVAIPLLVASWVVGLGFAIFLPFAIVVTAAWLVAR
ncbi:MULTISPECIES: hypothetical protein [Haloferax]|uniref:Uncharacterized protein n=1 Tax=Haloferax marinum TaxID=2666143 RepID=A0A6A8G8E5_9EURY|nr:MULTISPECIES: hypothetical protein [Haloferax]KAB1198253.1 hypothetical protein Hfx1150_12310 [Haloferax sp. CBA1150]MRW97344.1 hypothetical protein [Haloferax marinum]